jgi:asparagine synthetase B (glutamine-hydrolysing)
VKVVLTGDCADELFGGYEKYLFSHFTHRWVKVPSILQSGIRRVVNALPTNPRFNPIVRKFKKVDSLGRFSDSELSYRLMCMGFQPEELEELLLEVGGTGAVERGRIAGQAGIGIAGQDGRESGFQNRVRIAGGEKGEVSSGSDTAIKGVTSEVDGTSVGGGNLDSGKGLRGGASVDVLDNYLDNSWEESEADFLNNSMLRDVQLVLEGDMLVKVDRMCMMHSLEARVPFLERELVEFALALPSDWKIRGKERKWILREAFRGMVPDDILDNSKKGFGVPVDFWFRGPLKQELHRLLSKENIEKQGLFRWDSVQRLVNEHLAGTHNHKGKLWNLFVFQHWYERQTQDI